MARSVMVGGILLCVGALYLLSANDGMAAEKQSDSTLTVKEKSTVSDSSVKVVKAEQLALTIEELAAYNGKDGKPTYVAVDGVVYDVSDTKAWKKGKHKGYKAGTDITDLIKKKSPHGSSILKKRKAVGTIISSNE